MMENNGTSVLLRSDLKSRILEALKDKNGCTISDVSRALEIHPSTASKYLAVMEAEGIVSRRLIGMAKVFMIKNFARGVEEK